MITSRPGRVLTPIGVAKLLKRHLSKETLDNLCLELDDIRMELSMLLESSEDHDYEVVRKTRNDFRFIDTMTDELQD